MIKKLLMPAVLTLALLPSPYRAEAKKSLSDKEMVQKIMKVSGAEEQIQQLPQIINALTQFQLGIYATGKTEKLSKFLTTISKDYFNGDTIIKSANKMVLDNFNRSHADQYLKWIESKLGMKITEMEVAASSPEAMIAMMAYAFKMQQEAPDEKRLGIVEDLIASLNIEERLKKRTDTAFLKLMMGIEEMLPEKRRIDKKVLDKIRAIYIQSAAGNTESVLIPTFLFTYEALSDKELKKYADFLASDSAHWFNDILFDAQMNVIEEDSLKLGQALGKKIAKSKHRKKKKLKWKKFKADQGAYTVEFPGRPELSEKVIPIEGGSIVMQLAGVQTADRAFMVTWVKDYPPLTAAGIKSEDILTAASKGAAANVGGLIIESEFITKNGYEGIDYSVSMMGGAGMIRGQIFLVGKNFFQLVITGSIVDVLRDDTDRMIRSLNIK